VHFRSCCVWRIDIGLCRSPATCDYVKHRIVIHRTFPELDTQKVCYGMCIASHCMTFTSVSLWWANFLYARAGTTTALFTPILRLLLRISVFSMLALGRRLAYNVVYRFRVQYSLLLFQPCSGSRGNTKSTDTPVPAGLLQTLINMSICQQNLGLFQLAGKSH
jgi:hypothetical protein